MSRRFGAGNKLLADVGGMPVVRRSTRAYIDAGLEPVVVSIGYQHRAVRAALTGLDVTLVENPEYEQGQSRALVHAVVRLPERAEAAVIGVGDQPWLQPATIRQLIEEWQRTHAPIVAPLYLGRRGNPVLFARVLFPELADVTGDVGGRPVIQKHRDEVAWVPVPDALQAADIDTPADLPSGDRDSQEP